MLQTKLSFLFSLSKTVCNSIFFYMSKSILGYIKANFLWWLLEMSHNNVYQITCPGCNKTYLGKNDLCLHKCLSEHSTHYNTSAVAQHFNNDFYNQYDQLNDLPSSSNISTSIKNLIFNNYKILYTSKSTNTNKLLIIEELNLFI